MTRPDHTNDSAPRGGRAVIYTRAARTQAPQPLPQTAAFIAFANEQGFSNERISVYEDTGASAEAPLAGRRALSDLLAAIMQQDQSPEQEPIKAIYVASERRLFRDANPADLASFISACADHGIRLVTPTATYDFTAPDQVALFRLHCEQAAGYIAEQIGKLTQRGRPHGQAGQKPVEEQQS